GAGPQAVSKEFVRRLPYLTISLRVLSARMRTVFRAGLALNICGCLVKGLMPCRALVAGLCTSFNLASPGRGDMPGPFLPISRLMSLDRASKTSATCFRVSFVVVDNSVYTADFVIALPLVEFLSAIDLLAISGSGWGTLRDKWERRKPARDCQSD